MDELKINKDDEIAKLNAEKRIGAARIISLENRITDLV